MFKDEAKFTVRAGRGGDGCVSFRREAYVPRGGPDGGDGGRGGDVIFEAGDDVHSLISLARRKLIKAKPGQPGLGKNMHGRDGEAVVVKVPTGTILFNAESDELICDLQESGQTFVVAKGGKGGRGNKSFATSTHQVPRDWTPGRDGQELTIRAELKLIADVGLAGLPNAGKSTLLSVCSAAKPKVAAYPFTTLEPQLGIVERSYKRFVMADIPGLIEGASDGKGLGHQFLRHIERTRVLLHILDLSAGDAETIAHNYEIIRNELESFSPVLAGKRELVVGNKIDVPEARERLEEVAEILGKPLIPLSSATMENLEELLQAAFELVQTVKREELEAEEAKALTQEADSQDPPSDQ